MAKLRVGIAQIRSTDDPWENLLTVQSMVDEARREKVEFLCFPENVFYRGPKRSPKGAQRSEVHLRRDAEGRLAPHSDFSRALAECLAAWPMTVSLGSVLEETPDGELPYNAHWVVRPGVPIDTYRKIHLFVFESATATYRETDDVRAGETPVVVDVGGFRAGLSICFDLRFPELFRREAVGMGANMLLIPAAFTRETGEAHWHTLLRARAVENLSFVVAAGQWGSHFDAKGTELWCYGHSLIIDPWGRVLAEGPAEGDALVVADVDTAEAEARRAKLPVYPSVRLLDQG